MNYIKTYEEYEHTKPSKPKYHINDYVLIDSSYFYDSTLDASAKIIAISDNSYDDENVFYDVIFSDNETLDVTENVILRKLTEEEIKDFEIKVDTIKYNL